MALLRVPRANSFHLVGIKALYECTLLFFLNCSKGDTIQIHSPFLSTSLVQHHFGEGCRNMKIQPKKKIMNLHPILLLFSFFSTFFLFFFLRKMSVQFSVERPFGVSLFEYFDKAYTAVIGQSANEFTFVQGYTPLSTLPEG